MAEQHRQLLNRLKTVEGHVRGVQRMVEENSYCIDLIKQTQAVQRALAKVNSLMLEAYLRGEVTTVLRVAEQPRREGVIAELLTVYHAPPGHLPELPATPASQERTAQRLAWLDQIIARVRGIQQLLSLESDPVALIREVQAVQRMIEVFVSRVLADHLDGCVTTAIRSDQPAERERVVTELLQVFTAGNK